MPTNQNLENHDGHPDETERPAAVAENADPRVDSKSSLERFVDEELLLHWHSWVRADDLYEALWAWYAEQGITDLPYLLEFRALLLQNLVRRATTSAGTHVYLGVALSRARATKAASASGGQR